MLFASARLFLLESLSQRCDPCVIFIWTSRSLTKVSTLCITLCTMDSTTRLFSSNGRLLTMDWKV